MSVTSTQKHAVEPAFVGLGTAIRLMRLGSKLTRSDLVRQCAMLGTKFTLNYLYMIESGRRKPSSKVTTSICQALGITIQDLEGLASHQASRNMVTALEGITLVTTLFQEQLERRAIEKHPGTRRAPRPARSRPAKRPLIGSQDERA